MSNALLNEFYHVADNLTDNLICMQGLLEKLEFQKDESIEKKQCIEALRDFIDISIAQIRDAKDNCCIEKNQISKDNISLKLSDNLKMKNTKILIVDDNEINNYVIAKMLKQFNIEVDEALSGEKAIELYKDNEYDMVLMDYLMPTGMDGIEAVSQIRKMGDRGKEQLIIGLTSNTISEFKEGLNKYDVELILFKPVKYQQMAVILQKELANKVCHT